MAIPTLTEMMVFGGMDKNGIGYVTQPNDNDDDDDRMGGYVHDGAFFRLDTGMFRSLWIGGLWEQHQHGQSDDRACCVVSDVDSVYPWSMNTGGFRTLASSV